jgi:hypothetical protein
MNKLSVENWWNDADGRTEVLGVERVSEPLYPPQIPRGLAWSRNLRFAVGFNFTVNR